VRKVADLLRGRVSGFFTDDVRDEKGLRIGFRVTSLDGKRGELPRKGSGSGPRDRSYLVDVKDFERIALPSLEAEESFPPVPLLETAVCDFQSIRAW
jgi:nucleoside-triphosphatase